MTFRGVLLSYWSDAKCARLHYFWEMLCYLCLILVLFATGHDSFVIWQKKSLLNSPRIGINSALSDSFKYSGGLSAGILSAPRVVPNHIARPDYVLKGESKKPHQDSRIAVNSKNTIDKMRVAGKIAREVLDEAVKFVKAGITTDMIDELVHNEAVKRNSYPSPLQYGGFPKSCCTSINEIICHGIPDSTVLKDGDIVNVDITIYHDGVHGDCSETIMVGNVNPEAKKLVLTTFKAWRAAVAHCRPGVAYTSIGKVIDDIVTAEGYESSQDFCGHG